jgi:predicted transcriptional regulator
MTLTVRLNPDLDAALERYCAEQGVTKSLVVQQSLAAYLPAVGRPTGLARQRATVSRNYRAFAEAGLIGGVSLGQGADKAAVRQRVHERLAQRKPGRAGR